MMRSAGRSAIAGAYTRGQWKDPLLGCFTIAIAAVIAWGCVIGWRTAQSSELLATQLLLEEANRLNDDIKRVTEPAIDRGRLIAISPGTRQALKSGTLDELTDVCDQAIANSTEIDAVALFNAEGDIVAINTVYGDGRLIEQHRVDSILNMSFEGREIVQGCVRNDSSTEILEFQTTCDITPAYFDSSGLSIAHSIPVWSDNGELIGVVSTRMRFERLTDLVQDRLLAGHQDRFHFVTESGRFFDEAANAGAEPPVPYHMMQAAMASIDDADDGVSLAIVDGHAITLSRFTEFETMDSGGIIAAASAPLPWFRAQARSEMVMALAWPAGILVSLLLGTTSRYHLLGNRATAMQAKDTAERLNMFVSQSPAAIAIFDVDMRYIIASDGWYQQYGLGSIEITGKSHYDVFPTVPERWRSLYSRVLEGELIEVERDMFTDESGREIWVRYKLCPWHDSDGIINGLIMFTEVINQQIEHERELVSATRRAEEASTAKSEFLANMSHEIRTPMTAILGYADMLTSDDEVADNQETSAKLAQSILSNANHLMTIINDILDVSKIEAGQMTVETIETDPTQIIEEVASLVRPRAIGKGLEFDIRYDTPVPRRIESDPTKLRQILLNLVGNAIKFTEIGSVTIHTACDPSPQHLKFRIVDTGIGMTPVQLDALARFEAFSQADSSTTRNFGGSGLGLRISNALAIMLGGGVEIESAEGEGSTFIVTVLTGDLEGVEMIDAERLESTDLRPTARPNVTDHAGVDARSLEGVRVLFAEDGPDNQRLIRFHLQKAGAEVTICENGRLAVDAIASMADEELPHVVLMDMQMPVMDGYEATRTLRAAGFERPILALTAHAMSEDRERCIRSGCTEFLTKPIDKVKLVETCARYASNDPGSAQAA